MARCLWTRRTLLRIPKKAAAEHFLLKSDNTHSILSTFHHDHHHLAPPTLHVPIKLRERYVEILYFFRDLLCAFLCYSYAH
jgi:hypothetical protein